MPLPITTAQTIRLRRLRQSHPELGALAEAVAYGFDAEAIDNPELARAILEVVCRRIVAGEPNACETLVTHLVNFEQMGCLSAQQLAGFCEQIRALPVHLKVSSP